MVRNDVLLLINPRHLAQDTPEAQLQTPMKCSSIQVNIGQLYTGEEILATGCADCYAKKDTMCEGTTCTTRYLLPPTANVHLRPGGH